jgi:uncharacterized protein (DUF2252 family)
VIPLGKCFWPLSEAEREEIDEIFKVEDELGRNRSKSLEVPSRLWASVVQFVASPEVAYLEHCRQYAMTPVSR